MTTRTQPSERSAIRVLADFLGDSDAPMSAMLELADRCNEVCVHCYQVQGQKGEMTTAEVVRVLDDLARMGILFLTLSGGEITLRSDFLDIVAAARARSFAVKIYTNGLTMTAELADALAGLAVQEVQISLYSARAEMHDWITRVPGSFERTVAGIRHLVERRVPVLVKSPLMSVNVAGYAEWIALVESLGAEYQVDSTLVAREGHDRSPEALRLPPEAYRSVLAEPDFGMGQRGPVPAMSLSERRPCGACQEVHVEPNGEMRPCALLDVTVGNVLDRPAEELYRTSIAKDIRALRWGDLHGCRECDLAPYCSRCYMTARTESGDAFGPYASACERARLHWEHTHGRVLVLDGSSPLGSRGIGPYRVEGDRLVPFEAERTARDEQLLGLHPWSRRAADPPSARTATVRPGELVQIRRPGKRPKPEHVPPSEVTPGGEAG